MAYTLAVSPKLPLIYSHGKIQHMWLQFNIICICSVGLSSHKPQANAMSALFTITSVPITHYNPITMKSVTMVDGYDDNAKFTFAVVCSCSQTAQMISGFLAALLQTRKLKISTS